ncbi:MAG: nucleotide sugar dehydrogenase [Pseudomonadota bacterium]
MDGSAISAAQITNEKAARPATDGATPVRATRVSVVGLGYVGAVSVACLSELGFRVVGVDISEGKVADIAAGRSPIVEEGLQDRLRHGVEVGLISATTDIRAAIADTDLTLLSVGTPTCDDGSCNLDHVRAACTAIGEALQEKDDFHVVVMRCSVPPGTTNDVVIPTIAAASGKQLGVGFGVSFVPEFLREGVAIADFHEPPKTVIAATDPKTAEMVEDIFAMVDDKILRVSIKAAETVKYADNVWHATKVVFANEVGRLCKSMSIDSHEVMDVFVEDTKLNLSRYYLKPGFAFGGSCLPKEVRAVVQIADDNGLNLPLFQSLIPSNKAQVEEAFRMLKPFHNQRIGVFGVTFKANTDDLRESPVLDLLALLLNAGARIGVYDPNLHDGAHMATQMTYLRAFNPELGIVFDNLPAMKRDSAEALAAECDVMVVSHATEQFRQVVAARPEGVEVLDLVRLFKTVPAEIRPDAYAGIAW